MGASCYVEQNFHDSWHAFLLSFLFPEIMYYSSNEYWFVPALMTTRRRSHNTNNKIYYIRVVASNYYYELRQIYRDYKLSYSTALSMNTWEWKLEYKSRTPIKLDWLKIMRKKLSECLIMNIMCVLWSWLNDFFENVMRDLPIRYFVSSKMNLFFISTKPYWSFLLAFWSSNDNNNMFSAQCSYRWMHKIPSRFVYVRPYEVVRNGIDKPMFTVSALWCFVI